MVNVGSQTSPGPRPHTFRRRTRTRAAGDGDAPFLERPFLYRSCEPLVDVHDLATTVCPSVDHVPVRVCVCHRRELLWSCLLKSEDLCTGYAGQSTPVRLAAGARR